MNPGEKQTYPGIIRFRTAILSVAALAILAGTLWVVWAERNPEQEGAFRIRVQEYLHKRFPEEMTLPDGMTGFVPRSRVFEDNEPPDVVLLHGLDEPGGIWSELSSALDAAGINSWEFRYPNDQAIKDSADLLAEYWPRLHADQPIALVGHSMGGLVVRDFVSRWRHPVGEPATVDGPAVRGVILVGTPNQGSEWARLRIWLELREFLADLPEGRYSLFAGLRDGTGAAKIDLRPGSRFLTRLNTRPWPEAVPVRIIGGLLSEPTPAMMRSFHVLSNELGVPDMTTELETRWTQTGEKLGDGVVPVESLALPEAPPPLVVPASHRGLLTATPLTENDPPAIAPVMEILERWDTPGSKYPGGTRSN